MISIIVPIYNKSDYLKRCINSIKGQSYNNFECILVDDGSTDGSAEIAKELILNDHRFIYVFQENKGVSSARNLGIVTSSYEWICFIDADDYIDKDFLQNFINFISNTTVDVIYSVSSKINKVLLINDVLSNMDYYYDYKIFNPPWGKMYKRKLISTLFNEKFFLGEDLLFNLNFLNNNPSSTIGFMHSTQYNYSFIVDSLSNNITLENIIQCINLLYELTLFKNIQTKQILRVQSNSLLNKIIQLYSLYPNYADLLSQISQQKINAVSSKCSFRSKIMLSLIYHKNFSLLSLYLNILSKLKEGK